MPVQRFVLALRGRIKAHSLCLLLPPRQPCNLNSGNREIGPEQVSVDDRRESEMRSVSRVSPVQTAVRNCMRDEGGPFGTGDQELVSSHRKLLWSKAMVVSVAEKPGR